jgi:hypothetical protein
MASSPCAAKAATSTASNPATAPSPIHNLLTMSAIPVHYLGARLAHPLILCILAHMRTIHIIAIIAVA